MLTQGSTFTYQDVLDRLLVYTPETVSGGMDEMAFTLTDGAFSYTGRLEFTMDVTRTEGPRMTVNRGLQLPAGEEGGRGGGGVVEKMGGQKSHGWFWITPGTSSKITEQNLKGTDVDSDNLRLRYILTKDPPSGQVQLSRDGGLEKVSVKGPVQSFTQADVNKGGGGFKMGGKG